MVCNYRGAARSKGIGGSRNGVNAGSVAQNVKTALTRRPGNNTNSVQKKTLPHTDGNLALAPMRKETVRKMVPAKNVESGKQKGARVQSQRPRRQQRGRANTKSKSRTSEYAATSKGLRSNFGFGFTIIACIAAGAIFNSLVNYISLNAQLFEDSKKIAKLSAQLSTVKTENDALEQSIENNIDYDYIYNVATNEMGMVYASERQIIYYKHKESEYVEQYTDIK